MTKFYTNHGLVSALALVASIAVHTSVYSSSLQNDLAALNDKSLSLPSRSVSEQEREEAFQSGRVAFFKTVVSANPTLEVYDPLNHELKISTFDKNLLYLKPLTSRKYDVTGYRVHEDFFDSSAKATVLDKMFRSTSTLPQYTSPFFTLYLKGIPTCLVLKDEKELSLLVAHMRMSFERSGLTPSLQKPLLVVSIDGKTTELPGLFADADFLSKYFNLTSFADEAVQKSFLESHKEMAELTRDINTSEYTRYPNDGFVGGVVRGVNRLADNFNPTRLSIKATTTILGTVGAMVVGGLVKDPVMKLVEKATNKVVDPVKGRAKDLLEKNNPLTPQQVKAETQELEKLRQDAEKVCEARHMKQLKNISSAVNEEGRAKALVEVAETNKKFMAQLQYLSKDELEAYLGTLKTT